MQKQTFHPIVESMHHDLSQLLVDWIEASFQTERGWFHYHQKSSMNNRELKTELMQNCRFRHWQQERFLLENEWVVDYPPNRRWQVAYVQDKPMHRAKCQNHQGLDDVAIDSFS